MMAQPSLRGGGPTRTSTGASGSRVMPRRSILLTMADPDFGANNPASGTGRHASVHAKVSASTRPNRPRPRATSPNESRSVSDGSDSDRSESDQTTSAHPRSEHNGDARRAQLADVDGHWDTSVHDTHSCNISSDADGSNCQSSGSGSVSSHNSTANRCSHHSDGDEQISSSGSDIETASPADADTHCAMASCRFTYRPPPITGRPTVAKLRAARERLATEWSNHFHKHHLSQQDRFLQVHGNRPWCKSLTYCAPCHRLQKKHSLAAHNRTTRHEQRAAAHAAAQQADQVPPPRNETDEPPDGPDTYVWGLESGTERRAALDALPAERILQYQLSAFKRSTKAWVGPFATALQYIMYRRPQHR